MKKEGLRSRTMKKSRQTTNSNHSFSIYENVLNQEFAATAPHQVWMSDITYIPTHEGWVYLASIMD